MLLLFQQAKKHKKKSKKQKNGVNKERKEPKKKTKEKNKTERKQGRRWANQQKCPVFRGKQPFLCILSKQNKKLQQNKEGLRAKWGGPSGHLTWPLNPPNKRNDKTKQSKQKIGSV